MTHIFNFPYIKIDSILSFSRQEYILGANHEFQKKQAFILIYVETGQVIIQAEDSYIVNPNELYIIPTDKLVTFMSTVPDTTAINLIFHSQSTALETITNRTFSISDTTIIKNVKKRYLQIHYIRQRKPEIAHDIEIGEYFKVQSALLYADLTSLLLSLCEMITQSYLPRTIAIDQKININGVNLVQTKKQLVFAKKEANPLYKNLLINQVISYMKNNLGHTLTIELIAQEFLVSSSNLIKFLNCQIKCNTLDIFT